jgi:type VI secretion system protein VasD
MQTSLLRLTRRQSKIWLLLCVSLLALGGCAALSAISGVGAVIGVLESAAGAPVDVALTFQAGDNLNTFDGRATTVITKIYHLSNLETWSRLSMEQMLSDDETRSALGADLVASREITLMPGGGYSRVEQVDQKARYLGVATFFHSAAPYRWKYAFEVKEVKSKGVVIGAHACALSVPTGTPVLRKDLPRQDPKSLAFVQCRS